MRFDLARAVEAALSHRSDVLSMDLESVTVERLLTSAELQNSFSATLVANAGLNQRSGNVPDAYRNLLDQQQLSISFQIPIM